MTCGLLNQKNLAPCVSLIRNLSNDFGHYILNRVSAGAKTKNRIPSPFPTPLLLKRRKKQKKRKTLDLICLLMHFQIASPVRTFVS